MVRLLYVKSQLAPLQATTIPEPSFASLVKEYGAQEGGNTWGIWSQSCMWILLATDPEG